MQMRDREQGPQRWFKRAGDGVIFPMQDEYHCKRLLQEGWTEISEAEARPKKEAEPAPAPVIDPRDAEIAALKEQMAQLIQAMNAPPAQKPEVLADAPAPSNVAADRGVPRPNRRP